MADAYHGKLLSRALKYRTWLRPSFFVVLYTLSLKCWQCDPVLAVVWLPFISVCILVMCWKFEVMIERCLWSKPQQELTQFINEGTCIFSSQMGWSLGYQRNNVKIVSSLHLLLLPFHVWFPCLFDCHVYQIAKFDISIVYIICVSST